MSEIELNQKIPKGVTSDYQISRNHSHINDAQQQYDSVFVKMTKDIEHAKQCVASVVALIRETEATIEEEKDLSQDSISTLDEEDLAISKKIYEDRLRELEDLEREYENRYGLFRKIQNMEIKTQNRRKILEKIDEKTGVLQLNPELRTHFVNKQAVLANMCKMGYNQVIEKKR